MDWMEYVKMGMQQPRGFENIPQGQVPQEGSMMPTAYQQQYSGKEPGLQSPDMTPFDLMGMLVPGMATTNATKIPTKGIGSLLTRALQKGEIPTTKKPHGLYFTVGKKTPHEGEKLYRAVDTAKNVLHVDNIKIPHARFGGGEGYASAGVAALKKVNAKEFDELIKIKSKSELIKKLKEKYPDLEGLEKYFDAYELLEVYGARSAKDAGYDAIKLVDKQLPEFSEFVALTEGAVQGAIR